MLILDPKTGGSLWISKVQISEKSSYNDAKIYQEMGFA